MSVGCDHERGEGLLEESFALSQRLKDTLMVTANLLELGIAAMLRADHEQAEAHPKEGLVLHRELGVYRNIAETLEGLAEVPGERGYAEHKARLWGAADALREANGTPRMAFERNLHEPRLVTARNQMGGPVWEEDRQQGRALALEDAISYALEEGRT